jgi:hypothetical protein
VDAITAAATEGVVRERELRARERELGVREQKAAQRESALQQAAAQAITREADAAAAAAADASCCRQREAAWVAVGGRRVYSLRVQGEIREWRELYHQMLQNGFADAEDRALPAPQGLHTDEAVSQAVAPTLQHQKLLSDSAATPDTPAATPPRNRSVQEPDSPSSTMLVILSPMRAPQTAMSPFSRSALRGVPERGGDWSEDSGLHKVMALAALSPSPVVRTLGWHGHGTAFPTALPDVRIAEGADFIDDGTMQPEPADNAAVPSADVDQRHTDAQPHYAGSAVAASEATPRQRLSAEVTDPLAVENLRVAIAGAVFFDSDSRDGNWVERPQPAFPEAARDHLVEPTASGTALAKLENAEYQARKRLMAEECISSLPMEIEFRRTH